MRKIQASVLFQSPKLTADVGSGSAVAVGDLVGGGGAGFGGWGTLAWVSYFNLNQVANNSCLLLYTPPDGSMCSPPFWLLLLNTLHPCNNLSVETLLLILKKWMCIAWWIQWIQHVL